MSCLLLQRFRYARLLCKKGEFLLAINKIFVSKSISSPDRLGTSENAQAIILNLET